MPQFFQVGDICICLGSLPGRILRGTVLAIVFALVGIGVGAYVLLT